MEPDIAQEAQCFRRMGSVSARVTYAGDGSLYVGLPSVLSQVEVELGDVGVGHEADLDVPGVDGEESDDVLDEFDLFPEVTDPDAVRRVQNEDDVGLVSAAPCVVRIRRAERMVTISLCSALCFL